MKANEFERREVLEAYSWKGVIREIIPYGEGNINYTYRVTAAAESGEETDYILQRINTEVFNDPEGLMENVTGVTEYLRKYLEAHGGDPDRGTMHVIPAKDGKSFIHAEDGSSWRVMSFVTGTYCLQKAETDEDFYETAVAFGSFQNQLADYPAETLNETIANFHNTPARYEAFERKVSEDPAGRAASVADEIAFFRARKADCSYLADLLAKSELPLRVTHNDTKLNNVLFDNETHKGICVIDLDTVMPGLAAYDFGDAVRYGANESAEDEPDLTKVRFNMDKYSTYLKGYLDAAGESLTPLEKETLPWGVRVMALELALRFMTDYLDGDRYFHISRPGHNLDRARNQMKLLEDIEAKFDKMQEILRTIVK